jgi:iron complex outermembrane receptor protein
MPAHRRAPRAAAVLLALHACAVAHTGDPMLTEEDYFVDLPVVLSGSRLSQRLDVSPVAVTIIDRAMIEASGAREIQEVLRLAPGMIVGYHDGNTAFVTYHAFADRFARRMQVLVDGRSVYTPAFGGVDWTALPLALHDVERIEVIRGPNAAAYGANAYLGTINIVTREPWRAAGVEARLRHGERGVRDYFATVGHAADDWGVRLTAGDWGDRGFSGVDGRVDDKRNEFFDLRFDAPLSGGRLLFELGALRGARTAGQAGRVLEPPHDREVSGNYQTLRWDLPLGPDNALAMQLYHIREDVDERFDTLPIPALGGQVATLDYGIASDRVDFELQHILRLAPDARAVWGVATRLDEVVSPSFLGAATPEHEARLYRLFGHGEWTLAPQLVANAGLMIEHSDLVGGNLSPRIALNWHTGPGRAWRTSVSRAVRTPVLIEERADQRFFTGTTYDQVLLSSGDLQAESILSWEVGYLRIDDARRLSVDARLFYDQMDDLITYHLTPFGDTFDGSVQDFRNNDRAWARGGEVQFDWRPTEGTRVVASYAYTDLYSEDRDERYSTSAPSHNLSLLVSREVGRISTSAAWYRYTRLHGLDTLDAVPGLSRLDARIAFPLGRHPRAPRLALTAQALSGPYDDMRHGNRFDTRLIAELTVDL